jgi:hypothetical protein
VGGDADADETENTLWEGDRTNALLIAAALAPAPAAPARANPRVLVNCVCSCSSALWVFLSVLLCVSTDRNGYHSSCT